MARSNYPGLKPSGDTPDQVSRVVNRALAGHLNNTFEITLTASSVSTDFTDPRIETTSMIDLMPKTAHAAAAKANCYFDVRAGGVTIHHASSANTDQEFTGVIVG